jgi:hypothetical protein
MTVGTPKAVGDGHTMGETGLKALSQALQYLLGRTAVGIPTLRNLDPDLGAAAESFVLEAPPVAGKCRRRRGLRDARIRRLQRSNRSAGRKAEAFGRYSVDRKVLSAYLERWPELRREREQREKYWRLRRRSTIELVQTHCWKGLE